MSIPLIKLIRLSTSVSVGVEFVNIWDFNSSLFAVVKLFRPVADIPDVHIFLSAVLSCNFLAASHSTGPNLPLSNNLYFLILPFH